MSDPEALYVDLAPNPDAGNPRLRANAIARLAAMQAKGSKSARGKGTASGIDPRRADARLRKF
jgi:hypothetical protein